MYKITLVSQLFLFLTLAIPMACSETESESPKVSCLDQVSVDKSVIAALTTANQTLTLRVQALSQLLVVAQRQENDAAAVASVSNVENKILQKMGLSVANCKIQIDGTIDCAPKTE